jgi:hypothetical protein
MRLSSKVKYSLLVSFLPDISPVCDSQFSEIFPSTCFDLKDFTRVKEMHSNGIPTTEINRNFKIKIKQK